MLLDMRGDRIERSVAVRLVIERGGLGAESVQEMRAQAIVAEQAMHVAPGDTAGEGLRAVDIRRALLVYRVACLLEGLVAGGLAAAVTAS